MMEPADHQRWLRDVRALGRRIDDPEGLGQAVEVLAELESAIGEAVTRLRAEDGYSWADVGRGARLTKQGAQQRWGRRSAGAA